MQNSKIAWTDHTFNPWIGCTRVSEGCRNCYAEQQNKLRKWNGGSWGPGALRKVTSNAKWKEVLKWEADASTSGARKKVFCASLADVFDPEASEAVRNSLWKLVRETPHLDWLVLSKRPENFRRFLPPDWGDGYENVWLGVTVENRKQGVPRIDILRATPARIRFLSCEPLLEDLGDMDLSGIGWVILGGESGHHARPVHLDWMRSIVLQAKEAGIAVFVKQMGAEPVEDENPLKILRPDKNGHMRHDLHAIDPKQWPEDLRLQERPDGSVVNPVAATNRSSSRQGKAGGDRISIREYLEAKFWLTSVALAGDDEHSRRSAAFLARILP